jgi:hypothetical protein
MILRALGTFGFALSVLAVATASPPPARAVPLQIDLTISFEPPGPPEITGLTGTAQFWWLIPNIDKPIALGNAINIGALSSSPGKESFFTSFIPTDPCIGQNSCQLGFSFGGTAGGFPAYAFMLGKNEQPPGPPDSPLALQSFYPPGPPEFPPGPPSIFGGQIFANDTWVQVGDWQVTAEVATPLPGALPLFATGVGALGLLGWRRKRRD